MCYCDAFSDCEFRCQLWNENSWYVWLAYCYGNIIKNAKYTGVKCSQYKAVVFLLSLLCRTISYQVLEFTSLCVR